MGYFLLLRIVLGAVRDFLEALTYGLVIAACIRYLGGC